MWVDDEMEFLSCEISNAVREAVVGLNIPRYFAVFLLFVFSLVNLLKALAYAYVDLCLISSSCRVCRFKVVVQTVVGQMKDQGIRVASRCLWDTSTDNYASCQYKIQELFCNVMIFCMYTD